MEVELRKMMLVKVNIGAFLRDELPRDSKNIKMWQVHLYKSTQT